MGMTMAEKVLAKASERDMVLPGQFVTANIDILMGHDRSFYAGYHQLWNPDKIVVINDHAVPAPTYEFADVHRQIREWVKTQIWIAISVYILVAILKKRLGLEQSLYTILQILSLILIERIPIIQAFREVGYKTDEGDSGKQLLLFN